MRRLAVVFLIIAILIPATDSAAFWRPRWTRQKPAVETRAGHRVAVAVGYARIKPRALSRDAAEQKARADLLRLKESKPTGDVEGSLEGSRVVKTYTDWRGGVYVLMEAPLP